MALTLMRTAHSGIVRDSLDFSTALLDAQGHTLAQGICTPMHMGSFYDAMRKLIDLYGGRVDPSDVFIFNDPYAAAGQHLPDIYITTPVFADGRLTAWATTVGPSLRCGRDRCRQQRARRGRDLPGGPADPDREVHGTRRAESRAVGGDRPQRAHSGQGHGRSSGPARRVPERRARAAGAVRALRGSDGARVRRSTCRTTPNGSRGPRSRRSPTGPTSSPTISTGSGSRRSRWCCAPRSPWRATRSRLTGPAPRTRSRAASTRPFRSPRRRATRRCAR